MDCRGDLACLNSFHRTFLFRLLPLEYKDHCGLRNSIQTITISLLTGNVEVFQCSNCWPFLKVEFHWSTLVLGLFYTSVLCFLNSNEILRLIARIDVLFLYRVRQIIFFRKMLKKNIFSQISVFIWKYNPSG